MVEKAEKIINFRFLLSYGLLAIPLAFAGLPLYMHIPDFYVQQFQLNIGTIGAVLLLVRLIDAFQDPLIGYLCDKQQHLRSFISIIGAISITIGLIGLCIGPLAPSVAVPWFAIFMTLATTGFSILTINITMIGGFSAQIIEGRVRISAWREAFGLIGLLVAAMLPVILQNHMSPQKSFLVFLALFLSLLIISFPYFYKILRQFQSAPYNPKQSQTYFALFKIITKTDRTLFLTCFLSFLAASIPAILVLFFIRDFLASDIDAGIFLALYFIAGVVFIPFWGAISRHFGPYKSWLFSMVVSVLTFCGAAFLSQGDILLYGLICVMSGAALGADMTLPPALIAGRIQRYADESQATQYYAALTFLPKVAMAIAAGSTFLILDYVGFEAGRDNSVHALHTLLVLYAVVPCILKTLSASLLWRLIHVERDNHEHT